MTTLSLARMERADLREVWSTEAGDFTPWLAEEENLDLLGDTIGLDLELEAQEKDVGPFRADLLCKDTASGNWVLIENQLERTDHTHLGQLLTYASGLSAVTIVWIAERFTDEHRSVLDWLNESTKDDLNFFGLEIELWKIGESQIAPKFNIISKPNDWTRSISGAANQLKDRELTATKKLQLEYWTEFRSLLTERGSSLHGTKPRPQQWNTFSIGSSDFHLDVFVNTLDNSIGVGLYCKGESAKPHFHLLSQQRDEVEEQIGEKLDWRELPEKKASRIVLLQEDSDIALRGQWSEQLGWLAEKLEAFYQAFSKRIKELDASDYEPPEDDE